MPPTDLTAAVPAPDLTAYQAETAGIVLDSLAPATRRAYRIALAAVDDWHAGREPTDATGSSPLAWGTRAQPARAEAGGPQVLPGGCGMSVALRTLALALLARWRPPGNCVIPPESRDAVARRIVADYVGQAMDFRYFIEDAGARELRASHRVPLAILTPARRGLYGVGSREMPLHAGTGRRGARHIWEQHGPGSKRAGWERLAWSDWLYVQRMVDELDPVRQRDGRWRLASPGWLTVKRRSVGFVLIAEAFGDALTPVTFYRAKR